MKLSPEERQRIYLEEKTRLEAREHLQTAQSPRKKSGRLKWLLLVLFGLMILATFLDDKNKPTPSPKTAAQQETETKAAQVKYDVCNVKLQKAKEIEMLYDISEKAAGIQVLVGPTYFDVPIETQKGFVEAVNCVLVKGSGGGVSFDLIHWQTGKRVAHWNGYRLEVD